jgi:hypothetical protein
VPAEKSILGYATVNPVRLEQCEPLGERTDRVIDVMV